ncbi:hypothetical protein GGS23DRAFT_446533 [Durotheca rogersii]|uniref:uncharacterized protein n=1 Tax=Durotheca rogersii TaxID=419775 RepID=UPI00221F8557|nr:uncharacterized protein GGS23DRAFT_446533 [Durotheca rogersii]KAI5855094.1 hypothetical protein GGS23DRAFT_446533 [Durotheca rogersii]
MQTNLDARPPVATPLPPVVDQRDSDLPSTTSVEETAASRTTIFDAKAIATAVTCPAAATEPAPPPYWEQSIDADLARYAKRGSTAPSHPLVTGLVDIAKAAALLASAALKVNLVAGHGLVMVLHHVPVLYGDDTVRPWPEIEGFRSACAAGSDAIWYGFRDGLADWVVLPYKGAKQEGVHGFLKGFAKGVGSIAFKMPAGVVGFAMHPLYGIYKEISKSKLLITREKRSRATIASPV